MASSKELAASSQNKVTYETTGGRFADNLLSYIHTKWVSYKYQVPLVYRPFIYSNRLMLQIRNQSLQKRYYKKLVDLTNPAIVNLRKGEGILFKVLYFPESQYERKSCISYRRGAWPYFAVDWKNSRFIEEVMKDISPRVPLNLAKILDNRINVAMHLRRGGMWDGAKERKEFPLKFLHDNFFIEQLKRLYELMDKKALYVHIFTDDLNPKRILEKYREEFRGYDIEFYIREENNSDRNFVLEDFFSFFKFDCFIHSESNYSYIPSMLGNYLVTIYPDSFKIIKDRVIYDHIVTTFGKGFTPPLKG